MILMIGTSPENFSSYGQAVSEIRHFEFLGVTRIRDGFRGLISD